MKQRIFWENHNLFILVCIASIIATITIPGLYGTCLQTTNPSNIGENKKFLCVKLNVELTDEHTFKEYTVRTYRNHEGEEAFFEVYDGNRRIYAELGSVKYVIGDGVTSEPNSLVALGKDITGDGKPNMVISNWNGGRSSDITIFQLVDFQKLTTIHANPEGQFCDLDGDTNLEFVTYDERPYHSWHGGPCCASPRPKVILRYINGQYHIATDQMTAISPSDEEMMRLSLQFSQDKNWNLNSLPPFEMIYKILELLYNGYEYKAWRLFELSWPSHVSGKKEYESRLKEAIRSSSYFMDLQLFWSKRKEN